MNVACTAPPDSGSPSSGLLGAARARRAVAADGLAERGDQSAQRERDVGDDRVAHRRARRLVGIARDRDELGALGEQFAGDVRVVGEDRRAGDEHEVVLGEELPGGADGRRQHALERGMVLGEAEPVAARRRRRPDRQPLMLGELDGDVPAAGGVDVRARDERRPLGGAQPLGERGDLRVGPAVRARRRCAAICEREVAGSISTAQSSIGIETNAGPVGGRLA